jgi:hypothetical protein
MSSFPIRSAAPEKAVPPGRIGYDLDADVLLLHTIQTTTAFEELLTTGILRPDTALVDSSWPDAYGWMCLTMAARLPTSGEAALWLWARIRRVDLVGNCRRARGEVLLTCRIPRKRVLLSHFDEWRAVLNANVPHPETRRVPMPYGSDDPPYGEWITPSAVERVLGHLRRTPQGSAGNGFHEVVSFLHGGLRT